MILLLKLLMIKIAVYVVGGGDAESSSGAGFSSSPVSVSSVMAMYVLGDSSVDCGDNTLFHPLISHHMSLHPCNGSDTTLVPQLLVEKISLPHPTPFYGQNGSIKALLSGVNFGSAEATILNPSSRSNHQSLNQQLRQALEMMQLLQLHIGQEDTNRFIQSSIFYLSFGKDDYVDIFLHNSSNMALKYNGEEFALILVDQMINTIRDLYDANVRKIVYMGILPLGCAPRTLWESRNHTVEDDRRGCEDDINNLVLEYNTRLEHHIVDLNVEFSDAKFIFCDVYRVIMELINNPSIYGFEDVTNACCGLGTYGAMNGCQSMDMACSQASRHIWWDLYNPTQAVNSLIADSAWSGQPLPNICRPISVQQLVSDLT